MISIDAAIAASVVVLATLIEFATRRIPNWLTAPSILAGLVLGIIMGDPLDHFLGFVLLGVIATVLFAKHIVSGGTAKLLMAVGALAGITAGLCALWGLLMAYAAMWTIGQLMPPTPPAAEYDLPDEGQSLPSSPFILLGLIAWAAASLW